MYSCQMVLFPNIYYFNISFCRAMFTHDVFQLLLGSRADCTCTSTGMGKLFSTCTCSRMLPFKKYYEKGQAKTILRYCLGEEHNLLTVFNFFFLFEVMPFLLVPWTSLRLFTWKLHKVVENNKFFIPCSVLVRCCDCNTLFIM